MQHSTHHSIHLQQCALPCRPPRGEVAQEGRGRSNPSNGANISGWTDKSGNSASMSQATSSHQPTFAASAVNGRGAVAFNGSQWMSGSDSGFASGSAARTLFCVFQVTNASTLNIPFDYGTQQTDSAWAVFLGQNANECNLSIFIGSCLCTTTSISNNQTCIFCINYNSGAMSTASCTVNGVSQTTSASGTPSTVLSNSWVGGVGSGSLNGYLCEVLLWSGSLSGTNQSAVNSYLSAKWGV